MHSLPNAVDEAIGLFPCLPAERVPLLEAQGRRIAHDIAARRDLPPFDVSAMDGYAVFADDIAHATESTPARLPLAGEARTGAQWLPEMTRGHAIRIFTGAEMPASAECVIAQEDTTRDGNEVLIRVAARAGHNVRARGSDVRSGDRLLAARALVRAGEIAMLASQDQMYVDVHRRPVVAIVSTGDELREPGEPERRGSIVNSNAHMLAALVRREGGIPRVLPTAPDDPERIRTTLEAAFDADLVLTSGGVSVGDHDHVPRVLAELGVRSCVEKVRMKPGKPVVVGVHGRVPVVGLPGNPASALVGFELFVAPGLRAMQGSTTPFPRGIELPLSSECRRSGGRPELARGRFVDHAERTQVELTTTQSSGALRSLAEVDCLVLFGGADTRVPAGAPVYVLSLEHSRGSARNPFEGRRELEAD